MRILHYIITLIIGTTLFCSCASQKQITYLQGADDGYEIADSLNYEIRIQPDDYISISVNSKSPELSKMFNLQAQSFTSGSSSGGYRMLGYLVDEDGNINFPQLGLINVEGKTRMEVTKHIQDLLKSNGLINDAIVTIQFLNFKVSVMGEVARPGTIGLMSDRMTIFDALSAAGDLTIYGQRENVKIIRETNGKRTVSIVDLRNADILHSPFYYLQQNDVIYVQPNKAKSGQSEINSNRSLGTWASITSVLLSAVSIILSIAL